MSLATDVVGLARILDAHAREIARFEQSLDRYESDQVRGRRVSDFLTKLRERTKAEARPWVASIFGDGDTDDAPYGTFWSDWNAAHQAVREAKDRAVSGVDWSRVEAEKNRLASELGRMVMVQEVAAWYHSEASSLERLVLEYNPQLLDQWSGRDEQRALKRELSQAHASRLDTAAVRRAQERVAEVGRQRVEAYRLLKVLLASVDLIGPFVTFDPLARLDRRIQATTTVDSWTGRVDWEFEWLDRVAGVRMPAASEMA